MRPRNSSWAKSRTEEIEAKNYTIEITQDFKDVTAEVMSAVKPEMSDADRARAIAVKSAEIAKAALYLASSDSSFVTGSEFLVDGGITAAYTTPL